MVDAVITPSGPKQWTISELPDQKELGLIIRSDDKFTVIAGMDNFLTGVLLGPYSSMEEARDAIAEAIGGDCSFGI
jgi:hypothetical protein